MKTNKLELQVQRFFRSGFKSWRFTNELYEAFYIHSGRFIAHFDKATFYRTRFQDPEGFFDTIRILRDLPTDGNTTRHILGAYARDYLARMEICEKYLNEQESV